MQANHFENIRTRTGSRLVRTEKFYRSQIVLLGLVAAIFRLLILTASAANGHLTFSVACHGNSDPGAQIILSFEKHLTYVGGGSDCSLGNAGAWDGPLEEQVEYQGQITRIGSQSLCEIKIEASAGCYDMYVQGQRTNVFIATNLNTFAYTFTIRIEVKTNLFSWNTDRLLADGHSQAIPSPKFANLGALTWVILGDNLGCGIDANSGIVTAGTTNGQIRVRCLNSVSDCYEKILHLDECNSCKDGACLAGIGNVLPGISSVNVKIGLGSALRQNTAGYLQINQTAPFQATPLTLQYNFIYSGVEKITENGLLRQVKGADGLANIVTNNAYSYRIDFYNLTNVLTRSGTTYPVTNSPFATVTITNLNTDTNKLRIIQTRNGSDTIYDYSWLTNGVQLTNGAGLRIETVTTTWSETNTVRTLSRTIQQGSDSPAYRSTETYRTNTTYGERLIQETFGSGGNALTNTYTYTTNGFLQQVVRGDGSWEYYVYDSSNRPTNVFSGFKNQGVTTDKSVCRMLEHTYTTNVISGAGDTGYLEVTRPRRTIEYLLGEEIGRSYFVALSEGERRQIQCVTPGAAWDNGSNLVTITKIFTEGFYDQQVKSVLRPDGTIEIFQYGPVVASTSANRTNIVLTGHPDSTGTNIDAGVTNILIYDPLGQLLSKTVIDEISGITIAAETYQYDGLKRLTNTTYLDGTSMQTVYDCCTASSVTERDGTVINYAYDALKRLLTTARAGITNANTYDAYGNVLSTVRDGTDGTAITNLISTFDDAARLLTSTDALGNVTTYTNYVDGSGQAVRKTTLPNSSTRIETYYKDGALMTNNGTAVHGVRYDYGVESEGGTQRAYTKEIKLTTSDSDSSEWTKTYQDMLKRPYKTIFADSAYSQTFYNTNGQAAKQVDPDGVTALFQYNNEGELEYTVIDVNTNGAIDLAGSDRISRSVTIVTNNGAANVRRTTTSAWYTTNDAATITSINDTSVDGLRTWSSGFGLTNSTWAVYSGGHKYVTNTLPDGSYSLSDYQYGRLLSTTRKDSGGNQIGATTNGYDAHGRLSTVLDARTGAITNGYDNADRITSVTTPSPNIQTTTTKYNNMGWVTNVVLPDNGSVISSYFLTGELATNSGARTYPVAYTYDYGGRLKTMTTWTNFANAAGAATTTWNYDAYRGFLTNKAYADGKGPSYTYKASGRLSTRAWARGTNTTYGYNAAGDLSTIVYSDSNTPNVTNTYDRRGRTITVNQGTNLTSLSYNDAGRLLSETVNGLTVTNSYDSLLRRTNLQFQISGAMQFNHAYTYDSASRILSVSDGTNRVAYSYLANSPLVEKIVFTNGSTLRLTTTKTYDSLNRLTTISNTPSADSAIICNYAYNSANQRTAITNADSSRWSYGYDGLGQVTSGKKYWSDGTIVAGQQFDYSFDDIGNRKVAASGGNEWGSNLRYQNYTVNNLNQYTQRTVPGSVDVIGLATNAASVTVNNQSTYRKGDYFRADYAFNNNTGALWLSLTNIAVLNNGTNADTLTNITGNLFVPTTAELYSHDADGNLTNDGRWMLTWDGENRLLGMESLTNAPDGSKRKLEFAYDWRSRRVVKKVHTWSGSNYVAQFTNKFLYDDWNLIADLNATNGVICSYAWGLDLSGTQQGAGGVGGLLAVSGATGGVHFVACDGNGNVVALVSGTNGAVVANYEYGPFGETIRASGRGAAVCAVRFSTKFQDQDTDLLYYGYRYHNSSIGRWLSRDPVEEAGGVGLYSFLGNDAINYLDYLGARTVVIRIYYNVQSAEYALNDRVKKEVERILLNCVSKCKPCDDSANHTAGVFWNSTTATPGGKASDIQTGYSGNPTKCGDRIGYNHYCFDNFKPLFSGPAIAQTLDESSATGLIESKLQNYIRQYKTDRDLTLGAIIAHEIGLHGLAEQGNVHFSKEGSIDSTGLVPSAIGGDLSNEGCKKLCDALNRTK